MDSGEGPGPQDSPGAARINREARTRRQGAPSKGGVAGTAMALTGVPGVPGPQAAPGFILGGGMPSDQSPK